MSYPAPAAAVAEAVGTIGDRAREAAEAVKRDLPALPVSGHLVDAADALDRGNAEGAKRHLRAAMQLYSPVSLYRHGLADDDSHRLARQHLAASHRLHLQIQEAGAAR